MKPSLPIVTERLRLRAFTLDDLDDLAGYLGRDDVSRFLLSETLTPRQVGDDLRQRLTLTSLESQGDRIVLGVEPVAVGRVVGDVMLAWTSQEHLGGEIGFVFHPDHQGQGYATEAAREMLRFGFEEFELHRIVGRCDRRNLASAGVLERLGMRREAHLVQNEFLKGEWTDELIYAMLESEWRQQK